MTLPGTTRLVPWLARRALVITCAAATISAIATAGPAAASTRTSSPPPGMLTGTTVAGAGLNVVNGQVFVPAGGQVKVSSPRVDQVLFRVVPPLALASRMR